jgi:uncharacterized protein
MSGSPWEGVSLKVDLHTFSGVYTRGLDTLAHLLTKGAEFAKSKGASEAEMLDWRLAPDMFSLRQQAQTVIRFAEQWTARTAGVDVPPDREGEWSLQDLLSQITEVKAYVAAFGPEKFEGREAATVTVSLGQLEPTFPIGQWVPNFSMPNFYFHLSMAYAILRQRGLDLTKRDFFAGGL